MKNHTGVMTINYIADLICDCKCFVSFISLLLQFNFVIGYS